MGILGILGNWVEFWGKMRLIAACVLRYIVLLCFVFNALSL